MENHPSRNQKLNSRIKCCEYGSGERKKQKRFYVLMLGLTNNNHWKFCELCDPVAKIQNGRYDTQHNDIQHNNMLQNGFECDTALCIFIVILSVIMISVTFFIAMLSVIKMSVVLMSVTFKFLCLESLLCCVSVC